MTDRTTDPPTEAVPPLAGHWEEPMKQSGADKQIRVRRNAALWRAATVWALSAAMAVPAARAQPAPDPSADAAATQPLPPQPAPVQTAPATRTMAAPSATRQNSNANGHATTRPGGGIMLNFKDASINTVLDELSAVGGFIVVKQVEPQGRVTLVSKQPVKPDEAVSLLNTVLRNAGYTAIQQGRILKIVQRDAAKRLNIPVRTGSDPAKIEATDELITQVIPLRFADATQLQKDLQPVVNPEADFTSNASSNALVITDTSANIRRIVEIVNALDTHMADAIDVKVFQLEYASAANAARLVNEVFGGTDPRTAQLGQGGNQSGGSRGSDRGGRTGGGFPGGGFPGGPGGDFRQRFQQFMAQQGGQPARTAARVTASSDDRTNVVVVTGPADTLEIVGRVLKELDSNPTADETVFVYRLKNGQSLNVESVMNMLFNGTSTGSRGSTSNLQSNRLQTGATGSRSSNQRGTNRNTGSRNTGGQTSGTGTFGGAAAAQAGRGGAGGANLSAGALRTAGELAGQVSIIADPDTNSLLIRTAPKNYERVRQVLDELDRPVAQVLIKVLIAEITHTDTRDLGAEFSVLNLRASGNGQRVGTDFGVANSTSGVVVQILESNLTATLRALETSGKLDVLSRPYILASDNQLASITVGQEVPFITSSRITDDGGIINTTQYDEIGILLDVIPHINPDGLVILDVAPEISTLTSESVQLNEQVSQPVIAKRSAQSRVAVQNGQTIVIGGLMEDRATESIRKVPLLGDIPLVGELFKRRQNSKSKTELLIFLTPHVASRPDLLQPMSQDELDGTRLVPNAVHPGAFDEHMEGMQRGRTTTQPSGQ